MAYRTLQPVSLRSLWQDAVLQLSQQITPPRDFMDPRDLALTLLLSYDWKTDRILQKLEESKDEVYEHVNLCMYEHRDSKCLGCVEKRHQELVNDRFESYMRCTGPDVRQAAVEQTSEMLNPCCGCLCEEHAKTRFHYDLTASWGMLSAIQKCPHCKKVYPKPLIRESDLERFWEEIDGWYRVDAVKVKV